MSTDIEIDRALAAVSATLNDQKVEHYERERIQEIVTGTVGGEQTLTVDDGGGLHDESGARIGAIRRTPSGEWIVDRPERHGGALGDGDPGGTRDGFRQLAGG